MKTLAVQPGEIIIDASTPGAISSLRSVWEYRDLLRLFTRREIQLRYKQTAVGISWAILQPLLIMLVLAAFASRIGVRTGRVPYPLFSISGLIPWMYFTHALTKTTFSLVSEGGMMTRIYFPRLLLPLAAAAGGAGDFFAAALLLPFFMLYYGVRPAANLIALPLFAVMALAAALAIGIWLAVINVRYRDAGNVLPFLTQLLFFATPIVYPATLISEPWRTVAGLNPMFGVVEGFQWAIFGVNSSGLHWSIAVSAGAILGALGSGVLFFCRQESVFTDSL